jgi:hypothetical protein
MAWRRIAEDAARPEEEGSRGARGDLYQARLRVILNGVQNFLPCLIVFIIRDRSRLFQVL